MAIMYTPESENEPRAQGGIQVPRRKKRRMAMPEEHGEMMPSPMMQKKGMMMKMKHDKEKMPMHTMNPEDTQMVMKKSRARKY